MSNSIWKTGDLREASTKKLILYFAGGGRIPYTGWNHPDIMMLSSSNESWWNYTDVMRWCYIDDLIAQADKAERLQKAVFKALDALDNIMETYDSKYDEPCNRFYDANVIATKAFDEIKQLIKGGIDVV